MDADEAIVDTVEALRLQLAGLDGRSARERLEDLYPDLRSTLGRLVAGGRTAVALRLATALAPFWSATRRLADAAEHFDAVLAAAGEDSARRGSACFEAGLLAFWQGDDERARRLHDEALAIGQRHGDTNLVALALSGHARIELRSGTEEARRLCRETLALTDGTDADRGRGSAIHVLAVAAQMAGDLEEARGLMAERLEMARANGAASVVSSEAGNLSLVELQLGNLERAAELVREGLAIDIARGDDWAIPYKLNALAAIEVRRGDLERAATFLGAAEAMMEAQGTEWPPDERIHYEHTLTALGGDGEPGDLAAARARGHGFPFADVAALAGV